MVGIGHFNCKGDWAYAQFFFIKNVETAEFFSATPTFIIEPFFYPRRRGTDEKNFCKQEVSVFSILLNGDLCEIQGILIVKVDQGRTLWN